MKLISGHCLLIQKFMMENEMEKFDLLDLVIPMLVATFCLAMLVFVATNVINKYRAVPPHIHQADPGHVHPHVHEHTPCG